MSAADGTVIGATRIEDRGPASSKWNLVLVSEGYTAGELPQFHQHCQDFLDHLYGLAPFDERGQQHLVDADRAFLDAIAKLPGPVPGADLGHRGGDAEDPGAGFGVDPDHDAAGCRLGAELDHRGQRAHALDERLARHPEPHDTTERRDPRTERHGP